MATFLKRAVDPARVAAAEAAAMNMPLGGDPRLHVPTDPSIAASTQPTPEKRSDGYKVGSVYDIPLELIKSNPVNPRALYTSQNVDKMAISLRENGQNISATGYADDQGRVFLIEGETRLRAARTAGFTTLRIEIKKKPESERALYEEARAANVERREQTPLDDAIAWRDLLDRKVYETQSELAKALGLGEDDVSRILSLSKLPQRVIVTVADHPDLLTLRMLNALREFCSVKGEQDTIELILEASASGLGYRDVEARRKAAESGPITRKRGATETLAYGSAKGEIKTFEDGGRLQIVLKGLTPEESQTLIANFKEILASKADT